jgi:hypothetical protein
MTKSNSPLISDGWEQFTLHGLVDDVADVIMGLKRLPDLLERPAADVSGRATHIRGETFSDEIERCQEKRIPQWEYCQLELVQDAIIYVLYSTDNAELKAIERSSVPRLSTTWSMLIATLGLQGWEAITISLQPQTHRIWVFKRLLRPDNPYLELSVFTQ